MRRISLIAVGLALSGLLAAGCSRPAPAAPPTPGGAANPPLVDLPPGKTPPEKPPEQSGHIIWTHGGDVHVPALTQVSGVVWAPSGALAAALIPDATYKTFTAQVIDVATTTLTPVPDLVTPSPVFFWSNTELAWLPEGTHKLMLRKLSTGKDQLLYDFGGKAVQYIRPGDQQVIFCRVTGEIEGDYMQKYPYGAIIVGAFGSNEQKVVLQEAAPVGRMADGSLLAVKGKRYGQLVSVSPSGKVTTVSSQVVLYPQISPDGKHAMWFTGPAVAPDPKQSAAPITGVGIWDGVGTPGSIALSVTASEGEARFSPDGKRIALAVTEQGTGKGFLYVIENGISKRLVVHDLRMSVRGWAGDSILFWRAAAEKTGAPPILYQAELDGSDGLASVDEPEHNALFIESGQNSTRVYFPDATPARRIRLWNSARMLPGSGADPYLSTMDGEGLHLLKMTPEGG